MNINYLKEKIKSFVELVDRKDIISVLIIIFVAFSSFGLGRLSKIEESKEGISIIYPPNYEQMLTANVNQSLNAGAEKGSKVIGKTTSDESNQTILASKNGTKYYFTWCSGVSRIKEENKIWFATEQEAQMRGLTKSSTCK
ncbi:MAG: hypothetical protein WC894_05205 [Patescibacteria group bacterium]